MIYVTEYASLATDGSGAKIAAGMEPATAEQSITISGNSEQSAPFADTTRFVMVHASVACHIAFGENPTANPMLHRLGAGETRFYGVLKGHRLAATIGL